MDRLMNHDNDNSNPYRPGRNSRQQGSTKVGEDALWWVYDDELYCRGDVDLTDIDPSTGAWGYGIEPNKLVLNAMNEKATFLFISSNVIASLAFGLVVFTFASPASYLLWSVVFVVSTAIFRVLSVNYASTKVTITYRLHSFVGRCLKSDSERRFRWSFLIGLSTAVLAIGASALLRKLLVEHLGIAADFLNGFLPGCLVVFANTLCLTIFFPPPKATTVALGIQKISNLPAEVITKLTSLQEAGFNVDSNTRTAALPEEYLARLGNAY